MEPTNEGNYSIASSDGLDELNSEIDVPRSSTPVDGKLEKKAPPFRAEDLGAVSREVVGCSYPLNRGENELDKSVESSFSNGDVINEVEDILLKQGGLVSEELAVSNPKALEHFNELQRLVRNKLDRVKLRAIDREREIDALKQDGDTQKKGQSEEEKLCFTPEQQYHVDQFYQRLRIEADNQKTQLMVEREKNKELVEKVSDLENQLKQKLEKIESLSCEAELLRAEVRKNPISSYVEWQHNFLNVCLPNNSNICVKVSGK
ncbi:unnamed protein product [Clavelina lepadiformis]|uniref:Uncharacterized protein n=1 Tax=Clavelina lepadiformis TaxID=159417 RepID=A0ABP0FRV2_CLALP